MNVRTWILTGFLTVGVSAAAPVGAAAGCVLGGHGSVTYCIDLGDDCAPGAPLGCSNPNEWDVDACVDVGLPPDSVRALAEELGLNPGAIRPLC